MNRLRLYLLALTALLVCTVKADEGMWLLQLMQQQHSIDMMKKQGLKLEAQDFQVSALASLQFRKHGIGHLHKVTVLFAIDDAEGMHVGVLAEIFQLGLFVVGVYRYVDGTYLGASV